LLELIGYAILTQWVGVLSKISQINLFIMSKNIIIAIVVLVVLVALVFVFGSSSGPVTPPEGEVGPDGQPTEPGNSDQPPAVKDGEVVSIYFVSRELMEDGTVAPGHTLIPVERTIPEDEDTFIPEEALKLLLAGPVGQETETLTTAIPAGTTLNELLMRETTAFVDFSEELAQASGAATINSLREQVYQTLIQFDEIVAVVMRINGRPIEDFLRP